MESIWSGDPAAAHFGNWIGVAIWILLYGVFLAFVPFYRKSQRKYSGAFLAFVIAFALEMFGIPASMYVLAWVFGRYLPDGILWGHTLGQYIGFWGMYVGVLTSILGVVLVIFGWKAIHKYYWSKEEGKGRLVTEGIYAYIRHPQYTGFMLITCGMLFEWATLPLLIMWPLLGWLYYRLALREEAEMAREFGAEYEEYRRGTSMFLPLRRAYRRSATAQPA